MKQEILNKAKNIILARKIKAEDEYLTKRESLYKFPEFKDLETRHIRVVIENAKKISQGLLPDTLTEESLLLQIRNFEKQAGIDSKPNYSCKTCNDEGVCNGEMCSCLKKEISKILLQESGFINLKSFEDNQFEELNYLFSKMKEWCNKTSDKNLIFISGPTGVGKTFLTKCMANELINKGKITRIETAFNICQNFKEYKKTDDKSLISRYFDCEFLFIDDLGTEPIYKNTTIESLYLVINERKMKNLSTIITSNLTLKDILTRYDERIFSRIVDRETSINIFIDGKDKRILKN